MADEGMVSDVGRLVVLEKRMSAVEARLGILPDNELWGRVGSIEQKIEELEKWSSSVGRELDRRVKVVVVRQQEKVRRDVSELMGELAGRVSALEVKAFGGPQVKKGEGVKP